MSLKYDATLKDVVQERPLDWLTFLGVSTPASVEVRTSDLSTLTASTDLVFDLRDSLVHLDFQTGPDATLPGRLLLYNSLLYHKEGRPVHGVAILLRRRALHPSITGEVRFVGLPGKGEHLFRYQVVRVWEQPADELLRGGLGTLPLAVLAALPEDASETDALAAVIEQLVRRVRAEAPAGGARKILTAAFLLTGLRVRMDIAESLFRRVEDMGLEESSTYQGIMHKGARRMVLRVGKAKFGAPDAATIAAIEAIDDVERLEVLGERLLHVNSWRELLEGSAASGE